MKASIVIGTFNGGKKISLLLDALLKQSAREFEVIVVVDGSTDNTFEVVDKYKVSFKKLRIIVQENCGRSKVRNRGACEALAEIVIFYDDDMIPYKDSVQKHIEFHLKYNGLLCGNQIELSSNGKTDIQNYKAYLTKVWTKKYNEELTLLDNSNLFFTAANASIRKELFRSLNGFNEKLTDAEDHDLASRAISNNVNVFFDKSNKAVHRDLITCRSYIERLRLYAKAHAKLKMDHPERYETSVKKDFITRAIYKICALPFLVTLIDKQIFKLLLPKKIRYKFYDVVIQALAREYPDVLL
jgi:glycosyltransferase involved in cell wall biosynthesis